MMTDHDITEALKRTPPQSFHKPEESELDLIVKQVCLALMILIAVAGWIAVASVPTGPEPMENVQ
jgi:hypothetical protein